MSEILEEVEARVNPGEAAPIVAPVVPEEAPTNVNPNVNKDGVQIEPEAPHESSGMAYTLKQYLEPKKEVVIPVTPVVEEEKPPAVVPEVTTPAETDYTKFTPEQLIKELNSKTEALTSKDTEISSFQKQIEDQKATNVAETDFGNLKKDFVGNYEAARKKYGLPALDTIKDMLSEGDPNESLKKWQGSTLQKAIEDKHDMLEGEFEYDASEASKVGTPSYDWDEMTNNKKAEVFGVYKTRQDADQANLETIKVQQAADIKWLGETIFESEEVATQKVQDMQGRVDKIVAGELDTTEHPFAIRNLVRGVYHEEIKAAAVKKATDGLIEQFAKHQMYLPGKPMPTDASAVSTPAEIKSSADVFTKDEQNFSPMYRSMNLATKQK